MKERTISIPIGNVTVREWYQYGTKQVSIRYIQSQYKREYGILSLYPEYH